MARDRVLMLAAVTTAVLAAMSAGCAPPASEGAFDSPDPASRIYAVHRAGRERDASAVPHLIEALDSDDMAVRMYAIQALVRITGRDDRFGYDYYAMPADRDGAVRRWAAAYERGEVGPARSGADGSGQAVRSTP